MGGVGGLGAGRASSNPCFTHSSGFAHCIYTYIDNLFCSVYTRDINEGYVINI